EIDQATGKATPRIDGRYLISVLAHEVEDKGQRAVGLTFNKTGGALLQELTRKNMPSGNVGKGATHKRHLAILLDGLVITAPTINSEIGQYGQIAGKFTQAEVERLATLLRRTGPGLRPHPVAEIMVEPVSEK